MKARELQKLQFPNCLMNWENSGSAVKANIKKYQFSISPMKWDKLKSPVIVTFKNPSFQYLFKMGKTYMYSLKPRFKSTNFESLDKFGVMP